MHAVQQSATTSTNTYFEPLLTDKQAAGLLGLHYKTVQRLARNGQIPAFQVGRFWRFRASARGRVNTNW